jgi:hypothetical protein
MTTRDVSKREQRVREKRARATLDFPRDEDDDEDGDDDAEENAGEQMFLCECSSAIWTVRMYSVKHTNRGASFFLCG